MHRLGRRGARRGGRRLGQSRGQGGRLLQQKRREINEWHQRRNHLDQHKHGDRDSRAHSDRIVLHIKGKVRQESCLQRTVMTLQGGVRETRSHGLPLGTRSSATILLLPSVFPRRERILLQLPSLLLHQGQFQITA